MEKSTYLALGAIVLGAGYASSASSATIFINPSLTNASFETSNNPTATPPGWTPSGQPGCGRLHGDQCSIHGRGRRVVGRAHRSRRHERCRRALGLIRIGRLAADHKYTIHGREHLLFWVGLPRTEPNGTTTVASFPGSSSGGPSPLSWATMPEKGKVGSAKRRIRARYSNHKESSVSCNMFARWEATKLRRISTCFLTRSIHQEHAPAGFDAS